MVTLFLAILAVLSAAPVQCSTVDDTHYVAAVVDYTPTMLHQSALDNIKDNIASVGRFMEEASKQGVDIIVFPEDFEGFVQYPMAIPSPEENVNPCTATGAGISEPLKTLSCLAAQQKMYLVVNVVHEVPCTVQQDPKCPKRGFYHYNTDVVFDRSGKIVARYHKYNLFGEVNNNVPPTVEYSTFETDFGVRFGVFVCFDILFDKPAGQLASQHNVTDVVFTAAWFSEVPFLTAVQVHSGYAHARDVTVLAAGLNNPAHGSTGSGIYRGRHGILNATMNWRKESTMIVHRVPKHGHWDDDMYPTDLDRFNPVFNYAAGKEPYQEMKELRMIQDNFTMYTTELLPRPALDETVSRESRLCNNGLCCKFKIEARGVRLFQTSSAAASIHGYSRRRDSPTFDKAQLAQAEKDFDGFYYRVVAFSGVRDNSHVATTGAQVCGLISCLSEELGSCGWIAPGLDSPSIKWTEFVHVQISGEYDTENTWQFASTEAGPRYDPLPASIYTFRSDSKTKSSKKTVSLSLARPLLDLRTFAIYGRNFAWDGHKATGY